MKKQITFILTTVMATLFLFAGYTFGEYSGNYGYDDYGYEDYEDFEFRFENANYQLDRYQGPVYYFHHPRADVYFVLVGDLSFVVPAISFRPYLYRHNFVLVPRTRFISLSCCGLDYYDSYLRFNFYFDFYNRYKWSSRYHHKLRSDFRSYYHGRKHNNWYHKNRQKIMQHRPSVEERQRVDRYKTYKYRNHYNNSNNNYAKSSNKKYYNASGNYKKQVKKRNYRKSNSTDSHNYKKNRRNEKH